MGKAVEKRTTEGLMSMCQACPTDRVTLSQQLRPPHKGGQVFLLAVENRPNSEQRLQTVALPSRWETRLAQGLGHSAFHSVSQEAKDHGHCTSNNRQPSPRLNN